MCGFIPSGLLIPPDKKRQHCLKSLRQPGTVLLSRDTVMPPKESDGDSQGSEMSYTYGWQYQQLRGPTKSKLLKLSTGMARIRAKTDTWMTFPEFEELTRYSTVHTLHYTGRLNNKHILTITGNTMPLIILHEAINNACRTCVQCSFCSHCIVLCL